MQTCLLFELARPAVSVLPSVYPQSFSNSNEIWYVASTMVITMVVLNE